MLTSPFQLGIDTPLFWRYPVSHSFVVQRKITIPETTMFISCISWALRAMIIVGGQMSISSPNFGDCSWNKHTAVRNEQLRRGFFAGFSWENFTGEKKVGNAFFFSQRLHNSGTNICPQMWDWRYKFYTLEIQHVYQEFSYFQWLTFSKPSSLASMSNFQGCIHNNIYTY